MKTKTTALSKSNRCFIRGRLIANTPEERVRQSLIQKMVLQLGFPKGLISVERSLGFRRYDVVVFSKEMKPLLLIECKAGSLNEPAVRQAFGYNETLKAPFLCLANEEEIMTLWHEQGKVASVPFLPSFHELSDVSKRL